MVNCCHKLNCFSLGGRVTKVEGLDAVINLPYTNHNNYDTLFVGKVIKKNTDKTSRFIIAFEAKNHEELMQRREDIIRMIKVDVVGADGIVRGPIWELILSYLFHISFGHEENSYFTKK